MPIVLISGSFNLLEPSGTVQACNGIALPLPYSGSCIQPDDGYTCVVETCSSCYKYDKSNILTVFLLFFFIYLKALNRTRHALLSYTSVATSFKTPTWHTIVKCSFIVHWVMGNNNNNDWGMTLFTITGHHKFHFCIAVANIRFHMHFDCENTSHVSCASTSPKSDSFACWIMDQWK